MKMAKTMITFLLMISIAGAFCACKGKEETKADTSKIMSESAQEEIKKTESEDDHIESTSDAESTEASVTDSQASESADGNNRDAYIGQYPYMVEIIWKGCKPDGKAMTPEYSLYDKDGNEFPSQVKVLEEEADANGGSVYLGLPETNGKDYYLQIANVDLDTASSLPFSQATANIYDKDGKLLTSLDFGEWLYTRGQTGFWFYGVSWFTDNGLVGINEYAD